VAADYPEQMTGHILLALGVNKATVGRLLARELPGIELKPGSMLARLGNTAQTPQ
jgi:hypothetical protein